MAEPVSRAGGPPGGEPRRFRLGPRAAAGLALMALGGLAVVGAGDGRLGLLPVGVLYGDVQHALPMATTFLMLLTPVLYPVPKSGMASMVASLNPLTPLVTATRDWLITGSSAYASGFVAVSLVTLTLLLLGWISYRLALPHLIVRLGN